ncbi:putative leucine-rich repeat domain superfamily [Helianthus annuus]|uniref:Leucine-rich repeat domain superfamily n=1 Tax=Helianthus annuus TaxID=4232 RepID=A0A251TJH3_HELAN|nr:putative leucine-rich repeat domain superfamily [Helianthus annuus]KAJ0514144.1 putative leucine-rich repeat domain superfamily [Helianthus annuus]KAJ0879963.1 putative leucine-rich repeat domain superfamily [Helianthus annuus]
MILVHNNRPSLRANVLVGHGWLFPGHHSIVDCGSGLQSSTILEPRIVDSGREDLELTLTELIEVFSKKGTKDLNLQNKLKGQIEWLPDSVGKLSSLSTLDLSENRLIALPSTISGLSSLTKLDLHANKIIELPKIFCLSSHELDWYQSQSKNLALAFKKPLFKP